MKLSMLDGNQIDEKIVESILFSIPQDDLKYGDLIFVFGTSIYLEERMEKAVELYFQKRAPKMLLSGGFGEKGVKRECILMKEYALKHGVLEEDILLEEESNNTTENVLGSLFILQRRGLLQKIKRMLVVTSIPHMKRCMLTLSRYMPNWIEYSYCSAGSFKFYSEKWKKDSDTCRKLFLEVHNMIDYAKKGIIDDCEID